MKEQEIQRRLKIEIENRKKQEDSRWLECSKCKEPKNTCISLGTEKECRDCFIKRRLKFYRGK